MLENGPMRAHLCSSLVLSLLLACSAEEQTPPSTAATPAGARGGKPGTIAVSCLRDDAIEAATRTAVQTQALALHEALRSGQHETLWNELHPQARRDDQRAQFMEALGGMQQRLEQTPGRATISRMLWVDLSGGANSMAKVQCGKPDDADGYSLLVNAGGEDVAVVIVHAREGDTETATTIQLRHRAGSWRLLGIQANPSRYRGRDAAEFEQLATAYMAQQKVVPAFWVLGVAQMLSDRGASVESARHDRIASKLGAIARDQLFEAETGTWTVDGQNFSIEGLSLVSTRDGISPVIKYVSPQGLVEDLLGLDANALVSEVVRRFPETPEYFDTVVFEAYARAPDEPGKDYEAFRLVRYFDPAKRPADR